MDQDTITAITEIQHAFGIAAATDEANAVFASLLERLRSTSKSTDPSQFDVMLEIMDRIATEVQEALPNLALLRELNSELLRIHTMRLNQAAADIAQFGTTEILGADPAAQTAEFEIRAERIRNFTGKKVEQINALTALIKAITPGQGGAPPPTPPVDNDNSGRDDEDMLKRIDKLEADVAIIKTDVAVIKSNYANKEDMAGLKAQIAEARSAVATKEEVARMESTLLKWFIGTAITLAGLAFTAAKFVH